jgi:hypothetical protein
MVSVVSLTCEDCLFCYAGSGVAGTLGDGAPKSQQTGGVEAHMALVFHTSSPVPHCRPISSRQQGIQTLFTARNLAWRLQIDA